MTTVPLAPLSSSCPATDQPPRSAGDGVSCEPPSVADGIQWVLVSNDAAPPKRGRGGGGAVAMTAAWGSVLVTSPSKPRVVGEGAGVVALADEPQPAAARS